MRKRTVRYWVAVALGMYTILLAAWWLHLPSRRVSVTIPRGASAREIAAILYRSDLISFPGIFVPLVRLSGAAGNMKAGTYLISPRDSIFKIIRILTRGESEVVRVTVPEGFDSRQIAGLLSAHHITDREKFLRLVGEKRLEGYLFPETYFFEVNTSAEKVVDRMTNQFSRRFTLEFSERAKQLRMSERDVVILASIIEKEAADAAERPHMAGVFYNRLRKHWYLESCATVLYALGEHKEKLTYRDLRIDSPYNTYRRYGLPPGPICSPGLDSIKAALYPEETEDLFFVVNGSGTHSFSRYYADHLRNKRRHKAKKEP